MLVVVIIFMVTAPMLNPGPILELPQAEAQAIPTTRASSSSASTRRRVFLGDVAVKGKSWR